MMGQLDKAKWGWVRALLSAARQPLAIGGRGGRYFSEVCAVVCCRIDGRVVLHAIHRPWPFCGASCERDAQKRRGATCGAKTRPWRLTQSAPSNQDEDGFLSSTSRAKGRRTGASFFSFAYRRQSTAAVTLAPAMPNTNAFQISCPQRPSLPCPFSGASVAAADGVSRRGPAGEPSIHCSRSCTAISECLASTNACVMSWFTYCRISCRPPGCTRRMNSTGTK